MWVKVYDTKPSDFKFNIQAVGCFVEMDGKILFLKRAPHCSEPDTWCIPGGKVEPTETLEAATVRELFEETGIQITIPPQSLGPLYVSRPWINFPFHIFKVKLNHVPTIILSTEHLEFTWVTPQESKGLPLIPGGDRVVDLYISHSQ